jgi:hypothetical protein
MVERGVIEHRERARQIVSFAGLRFGNITPTDIDGLIEYKNCCFLLLELKHYSRPELPYGQRLALERLAASLAKPTLLLHGIHYTHPEQDIDAAECDVYRYFWGGEWHGLDEQVSVWTAAAGFFDKFGAPFGIPSQAQLQRAST